MSKEFQSEDGVESEPQKKSSNGSTTEKKGKGKELAKMAKASPPQTPVRLTFGLLDF